MYLTNIFLQPVIAMVASAPNPHQMHLHTHVLRLRIAALLPRIAQRNAPPMDVFERVHEQLVQLLSAIRALECDDAEVCVVYVFLYAHACVLDLP